MVFCADVLQTPAVPSDSEGVTNLTSDLEVLTSDLEVVATESETAITMCYCAEAQS